MYYNICKHFIGREKANHCPQSSKSPCQQDLSQTVMWSLAQMIVVLLSEEVFLLSLCPDARVCECPDVLTNHTSTLKTSNVFNPVHLRICVGAREVKEPCNRFICTIHKSFLRVKREGERSKKGLWISDRWGGFIWLQRLQEPFRPSFGHVLALSLVKAEHVMCLRSRWKSTPAVVNKKIQTILLSLSLAHHVSGYFTPISTISPFFLPFGHSFLLASLFCTHCPAVLK